MTVYSQAEFATHTLKAMGLVAAEETPSATDLSWATEVTGSEIALLAALNMPIWNGSELSVPQEYLTTLARRCALAVAPSFGMMSLSDAQMAMREAERYLSILASPRVGAPLRLLSNDAKQTRSGFNFTTGT